MKKDEICMILKGLSPYFYYSFFLGIIAYGFRFTNGIYSHDSLAQIFAIHDNPWQISIGRYLQPVFRFIFNNGISTPWFHGFLGLLFIALSSYLIGKIFNIKHNFSKLLLTFILTLNIAIPITVASFIENFGSYMAAQALTCMSVYLLINCKKYFLILSSFLLAIATAIYQLFFSCSICLILIYTIQQIAIKKNKLYFKTLILY